VKCPKSLEPGSIKDPEWWANGAGGVWTGVVRRGEVAGDRARGSASFPSL